MSALSNTTEEFGTRLHLSVPSGDEAPVTIVTPAPMPAPAKKRSCLEVLMDPNNHISLEEMMELDATCGTQTLTPDAYRVYRHAVEANDGTNRPPLSLFLHPNNLRLFRAAIIRHEGTPRSLTLDDLSELVGEDEQFICLATGQKATAVWWIEPFGDFLEKIEQVGLIEAKKDLDVYEFGAFYVAPGAGINGKVAGFSGPAYFILKQGETIRPVPSDKSPLGKAQAQHPKGYWGLSMREIERRRQMKRDAEAKAEADRKALIAKRAEHGKKADQKIADFFGKPKNEERLIIRNAQHTQGGGVKRK